MNQFIYVLKLIPKLVNPNNWSEVENNIVGEHFQYLQNAERNGTLILAGRTDMMNEDTFGIAIFQAETQEAANAFMENDPAVKKGVMTATLFPYKVALYNSNWKQDA